MDRVELETRLRTECRTIAKQAIAAIAPCAKLVARREDDAHIPIGATKFGGAADLPAGIEWPSWDEEHGGNPLALIAQIDLSQVAAIGLSAGLPQSGLLSFFYDTDRMPSALGEDERSGWRVIYAPATSRLVRVTPASVPDHGLEVCVADVQHGWSIPEIWAVKPDDVELPDPEFDAYYDLLTLLNDRSAQLLGYADPVQGSIEAEAAQDSGDIMRTGKQGLRSVQIEQAQRWRLLLEVGSDDELDVMWGDVGKIYYAIRKQDLAAGNFNETMLIFQCH